MSTDENPWTPEQTADFLHLGESGPTRLRDWRHKGGGPIYSKVGRTVLYLPSDVRAWLEENRYSRTDQKVTARAATRAVRDK